MTDLRQLEAAATPGPWQRFIDDYGEADEGRPGTMLVTSDINDRHAALYIDRLKPADAALIVALRNAAPFLLDVVDAARGARDEFFGAKAANVRMFDLRDALTALDAHLESKP